MQPLQADHKTYTPEDNIASSNMTFKYAEKLIGGLSKPSKMPWYSWSTPAEKCITGSKLRQVENSTCSSCYALKGCYVFPVVQEALERRFSAIDHPKFEEAFTLVLSTLYKRGRKTYLQDGKSVKENRFRWHDSGDIQSVKHLVAINNIAKNTPFLDHWLPTREAGFVKEFLDNGNKLAPNLTLRISATMIGQNYKKRPMDLPYSTVDVPELQQCVAYQQEGKCLDCRACWDQDKDINYPLH